MIYPVDIPKKEFERKNYGGWDPESVREYLRQLSKEFAQLLDEKVLLETQLIAMQERLVAAERDSAELKSVQGSLFATMRAAEQAKRLIVEEAESDAKTLLDQATSLAQELEQAAQKMLRDHQSRVLNDRQELDRWIAEQKKAVEVELTEMRDELNEIRSLRKRAISDLRSLSRDLNSQSDYLLKTAETLDQKYIDVDPAPRKKGAKAKPTASPLPLDSILSTAQPASTQLQEPAVEVPSEELFSQAAIASIPNIEVSFKAPEAQSQVVETTEAALVAQDETSSGINLTFDPEKGDDTHMSVSELEDYIKSLAEKHTVESVFPAEDEIALAKPSTIETEENPALTEIPVVFAEEVNPSASHEEDVVDEAGSYFEDIDQASSTTNTIAPSPSTDSEKPKGSSFFDDLD